MKPKEILRWVTVVLCGGFGIYSLITSFPELFRSSANRDWFGLLFLLGFTCVFAGIPFGIAYFAFRREYRQITTILATLCGFVVFAVLISVPSRFGIFEWFNRYLLEMPWLSLIGLPVSLLFLFGPFYAASWFTRICLRIADKYIHDTHASERIA